MKTFLSELLRFSCLLALGWAASACSTAQSDARPTHADARVTESAHEADSQTDTNASRISDERVVVARVRVDGLHGYIRPNGEWLIEPTFGMAYPFRGGYATVIKDAEDVGPGDRGDLVMGGYRVLVDTDGQEASVRYDNGIWDGHNIITLKPPAPRVLMSRHGVKKVELAEIGTFRDGRAVAVDRTTDTIGFIDTEGQWTAQFPRSNIRQLCPVYSGIACAVLNQSEQRCGWLDPESGEWVLEPEFLSCSHFGDDRAFASLAEHSSYGLIDRSGAWLKVNAWDDYQEFSEGRAFVRVKQRWGLIDRNGDWVVEPTWYDAVSFTEGFAIVQAESDQPAVYIDRSGEVVLRPNAQLIYSFREGMAAIVQDPGGRVGFIDTNGHWVFEPQFDSAHPFGDINALRPDH